MRLKPHILTVESAQTLRQIVENFELPVADARQALVDPISFARSGQLEDLLSYRGEPEVKQVCEVAGVDSRVCKNALIASLLVATSPTPPPPPGPHGVHPAIPRHSTIRQREQP
jgi:hypothetical protein